ncbi:MAG: hypothetical protein ACFE85_09375 [Candidatus Hodarchaeota archaeon]
MVDEILKFTKLTFVIHFVIAITFTILFFLPDISVPIFGITVTRAVHALTLTIASAFAGLTVSSLCGIRAKEWKEVKIVVILEVVWLVANLITVIISFGVYNLAMGIITLLITIFLLALFLLAFLQQEGKMKPLF